MLKNILNFGLLPSLLLLTFASEAKAVSLEIFESIDEVVGSSGSSIPVGTGGTNTNFGDSVSLNDSARFRVKEEGGSEEFAQLEIVYTGDDGITNTTANDHKVMVARTTNSQGLTDTGTASILINTDTDGGTGKFTFKWYEPSPGGTSTTPKSLPILYTTYDLDYQQKISFDSSEAQSITLDGGTNLSYTINGITDVFEPSGGQSEFDNAEHAVQILSQDLSSHTFDVGKTTGSGNALYMFEFRDPSNLSFVSPETYDVPFEFSPSLGIILCGSFFGIHKLRKRLQSN